ncbi:MAG: ABC transporter permease subunit [Alphaproteobacteria bacterium]|nr:ABC transporter permease subunit [Alphaproteobacteria bacterium]
MESWKRNPLIFLLTSLPAAFWLLVFFLIPLAFVWVLSFGEVAGIVDIAITWTLSNYARALDPLYLGILWQSLWIAALTTVICLVVGFPLAMGISFAPSRWKSLLLLLIILPFWTNLLIRTYALIAVLRRNGYVNDTLAWFWSLADRALAAIGLGGVLPDFVPLDLLYNHGAVIYGLVYVHLPFMVLPLYAALERMDKSYVEASLDLGAGQLRTLFSVTVPLAMPGIVSGIIITFIPALGTFLTPILLGGPDSQMIGNIIERQFKSANDWPFGAALSFLLMYVTFGALALRAAFVSRRRDAEAL